MFENIRGENRDILKVLGTAIIKKEMELENNDKVEYKQKFQLYKEAYYEQDDVYAHTYSVAEYHAIGVFDNETIILINKDIRSMSLYLSEFQMNLLLKNKRKYILENYEEENIYVRTLMGLPLSENEHVFMTESVEGVPMDKPLHEMTDAEIQVLESKGFLDKLKTQYPDYDYINYLNRRVDFLTTRTAPAFGILYANTTQYSIAYQVLEKYDGIRVSFMRGMYNEFYHQSFSLYESIMSMYLISSTIFTIITESPMNSLEFDFTSEDVLEAIYSTFSVPYISELPASIKISLAEKLNDIIRNKGSKSSIIDITSAFGIKDIYQYVLYKEYKDAQIGYNPELSDEENYDLSFIRVPVDASDIHKYIYSNISDKIPYADFVKNDERWGGGTDDVHKYILSNDFSYIPTKYIGVDSMVDLVKNIYNMSQFTSYLFANRGRFGDYKLTLQRANIQATLWDTFVYCITMIFNKNGYEDLITKDPESLIYIEGMNTQYVIDNKVIEEYRGKLPKSLHHLLEFKSGVGTMPITEFMSIILTNSNTLKALRETIASWNGNYEDYNNLYKLNNLVSKMTLNSYYKEMQDYESYSDYLAINNPTLFTHLEIIRLDENMETEMTDELVSVLDDLYNFLNPSGNTNIDELLSFIDKKKTDEMNTLRQLMFNMIAFLKSYTIDTKENNTVYMVYDYTKIIESTIAHFKIGEFSRLHIDESLSVNITQNKFSSFMNICDSVRINGTLKSELHKNDTEYHDILSYLRPDHSFSSSGSLERLHERVWEKDISILSVGSLKCNYKVYEKDTVLSIHETLISNYYRQLEQSYNDISCSLKVNIRINESSVSYTGGTLLRLSPYNWYSSVSKIQDSFRCLDNDKVQTDI